MRFSPGSPDDFGERRYASSKPPLTVITVIEIAVSQTHLESRQVEPTLAERVLEFLDQRAA